MGIGDYFIDNSDSSSTCLHLTSYTYDELGRIKRSEDSQNSKIVQYEYDTHGQLVRENNKWLDKTIVYSYNSNGSITSVKTYSYTTADTPSGSYTEKTYLYNANHLDRLISYSGKSISYNSYGYPTSYDGKTYAWTRGKLTRISSGNGQSGISTYTMEYNAYGQRTKFNYSYAPPLNGAVQMDYVSSATKTFTYDNSGRLISQKQIRVYNTNDSDTQTLKFLYDENAIIGFVYVNLSGGVRTENDYYFVRNLQGDVTEILDENGNIVVTYKYDAFGNCTTTSSSSLGSINPIRYRGYYYDQDTKLYYLNSRYYNPEWRRFISPDDTSYIDPESVNGLNLYCYCNNDPVNFVDPSGRAFVSILAGLGIAALIGASIGATSYTIGQAVDYAITGNFEWSWGGFVGSTIGGALGGMISFALPYAGVGSIAVGAFFSGAATNAGTMIGQNITDNVNYSIIDILLSSTISGAFSALSLGVMSKVRISGLNAGRGSYSAISNQIYTKFRNQTIKRITIKTFGKMLIAEAYSGIAGTAFEGVYDFFGIYDLIFGWR